MKTIRIILAGLFAILAILTLLSFCVGILSVVTGAFSYGSQRMVASLVIFGFSGIFAYLFWPRSPKDTSARKEAFETIPDRGSKAEFIASHAASTLRIPSEKYDRSLTDDLHYSSREIMDLFEDLADEFQIDLSSDHYPEIDSIDSLRRYLNYSLQLTESG